MWHTSRGDRTLRGEEAALVAKAIDTMIDALLVHVDDECVEEATSDCDSGIGLYDRLSACQRIGLLHEVALHLLTDTPAVLPLSATSEAAVAAIFVEVRDQVAIEIDLFDDGGIAESDNDPTWRQVVLAACQILLSDDEPNDEPNEESIDTLPKSSCKDMYRWEDWIDRLASAILWDRDFEMADSFLDIDPGISQQRRRLMGIHDDYFTNVTPDPRPEETFTLISKTREILRTNPR